MAKKRTPRKRGVVSDEKREIIKQFRLLDDVFMRVVLARNRRGVQDIVRVIMGDDSIVVKSVWTQLDYANPAGHSVQLDVLAEDGKGERYNIEIQRDGRGASPLRARYNFAAIDWNKTNKGTEYEDLPRTWVIFITEDPSYTNGGPIAFAERYFRDGRKFEDRQTVCYVYAGYVGDDLLGKLMADFRETDPDKMYFRNLAVRVKRVKESGMEKMSDILDAMLEKVRKQSLEQGLEKGLEKGVEKERARSVGVMLTLTSPDALLNDPFFQALGYTQADIDAALTLQK